MFGIKDLFTTINVLGGVVAICLCIDGEPFWAGVAILAGYVCGDMLDGYVARLLNSSNQFGAEYDTIADHLSHVVAPAAVVYTVYAQAGLLGAPDWDRVLAMALAGSMIVSVSIRHARNIVAPIEFKGVWAGLPRSVYGFVAIGYCNATFLDDLPGGLWIGVALIPLMGVLTLTYLPFPSHRMGRKHFWYGRVLIYTSLWGSLAFIAFFPWHVFDVLLFWMILYSFVAAMLMTAEERAQFRAVVAAARTRAG